MVEMQCMCLQCGRKMALSLEDEAEIKDQACPFCGGYNMVSYNPDEFFRTLFGMFGSGGG